MMNMVLVAAALAAAPLGTVADATPQDSPVANMPAAKVPLCSRTVTDECMNPSQAPRAHRAMHHRRHHAHAMKNEHSTASMSHSGN